MACEKSGILIVIFLIFAMCILILICTDKQPTFIQEQLSEPAPKRADCPSGYILSGNSCISDQISRSFTCKDSDKKISNGKCQKVNIVTCPTGFVTKTTHCLNPTTNQQIPFSSANCPDGYTRNGPFCYLEYDGICDPYFKNTHTGETPCVQDIQTVLPSCAPNEILKDGRCYSKSVDAFRNADVIEKNALSSLYK